MVHWEFLSLCIFLCKVTSHVTAAPANNEPTNLAALAKANDSAFPWPQYRLPNNFYPSHCEIFIYPHPENDAISGMITMDLMIQEWSEWVIMNQYKLNISKIVAHSKNKIWKLKNYVSSDEFQMLAIKLPDDIPRSSGSITLTIHYTSLMHNEDENGIFRANYTGPDGAKRPMYMANAGLSAARKMMPCFDEPSFKTKFTLKIVRPVDMLSLSSMPLAKSVPFTKDLVIDKFKTSPKMTTHLLGFVICNFVSKTAFTKGGTQVSVFVPNHQLKKADLALDFHIITIEYIEKLFGIPYPLPKLDITVSDNAYTLGNWGLIVYNTWNNLFQEVSDITNSDLRRMTDSFIVDNVIHQWVGSLVTEKFWNDAWVSEGLAQFLTSFACSKMFPSWNTTKVLTTGYRDYQMNTDSYVTVPPIKFDVEKPDKYGSLYSTQMFYKGSLMANFLFNVLGEDKFFEALREYLTQYSYSNVDEESLLEAFNKHAAIYRDDSLGDFVSSFTNQGGLPLLTVQKTDNGLLKISQKRFFNNDSLMQEPSNQTWNVLISIIFDNGHTQYLALFDQSQVFNINVPSYKWYKLNLNNAGFYRVNYDDENWQALFDQLIKDKEVFSPVDRYGIFSDMFQAMKHKIISLPKVFKFLNDYAGKEDDRRCLYLLTQEIGGIAKCLASTPLYETYKGYLKQVLQSANHIFDWSLVLADGFNEWGSARALSTVAYYDLGQFRKDAFDMVYNYIFKNISDKAFEYRRSIICGSAVLYDQMIWDPIYELYLDSETEKDKQAYFQCLFYGNNTSKISKLLDTVKNDMSFLNSMVPAIFSFDSRRINYYWNYFTENFDSYINDLSAENFTQFLSPLYYINTEEQFDKVKEFFSSKNINEDKAAKVIKIFETIEKNIDETNFIVKAFQAYLNM